MTTIIQSNTDEALSAVAAALRPFRELGNNVVSSLDRVDVSARR
jgi:hypothetical protein